MAAIRVKGKGWETLRESALKVLAMPGAASPSEGIWSVFEHMERDKRRSSLPSDNLRLQVFVAANARLERKNGQGIWRPREEKEGALMPADESDGGGIEE